MTDQPVDRRDAEELAEALEAFSDAGWLVRWASDGDAGSEDVYVRARDALSRFRSKYPKEENA
jgi:hypothetical protein